MNEEKQLWKYIFGDSDKYITLYFKNYLYKKNYIKKYIGNKLVSQLFYVDYRIVNDSNADSNNNDIYINSVYLCGLSTLPKYRSNGYMQQLICNAHNIFFNNKYGISFLIPADNYLRLYYKKFGYSDITYINNFKYVSEHRFCNGEYNIDFADSDVCTLNHDNKKYMIRDMTKIIYYKYQNIYEAADIDTSDMLNDSFLRHVFDSYTILAANIKGAKIFHGFKDFVGIVSEYIISGGKILMLEDDMTKPLSLIFCYNGEEGVVNVALQISDSEDSENLLLQSLKYFYPNYQSLQMRHYPTYYDSSIHSQLYSPVTIEPSKYYPEGVIDSHEVVVNTEQLSTPYAMARIINVAEVLKFVAAVYPKSKFSILITVDEFDGNRGVYTVSDGRLTFLTLDSISTEELEKYKRRCQTELNWYHLTVAELQSLLWRHTDYRNVIEKVIAIPQLPIQVALMLE